MGEEHGGEGADRGGEAGGWVDGERCGRLTACAQTSARPQVGQLTRPELCMLNRAAPRTVAARPLCITLASAGGAARTPGSCAGPDPAREQSTITYYSASRRR
jgi:hypothetical protein